jgi:hypothetical protein
VGFRAEDYPPDWETVIVPEVRARAGGRCECTGECGLHQYTGGPRRCSERDGQAARWAKGKVVLTTAHLCHDKKCARRDHLKHMCQRCHLRYDVGLHLAHRRRKFEREHGQLTLLPRDARGTF